MKKFMAILLATLIFCTALPVTAFAATVDNVELLTEPETLTYEVGDPFQAKEISFRCYYSDGSKKTIQHEDLVFTANGNPVKQGYLFKEPGKKSVVVSYEDYEYKFTVTVTAKGGRTLKSISLDKTPATLTYKVGQAFKASELKLRASYSDGMSELIAISQARIYANGNPIKEGYEFIQAGPKTVNVEYGGQRVTYKLSVVPATRKKVQDCELISEPQTYTYNVGDEFRAEELVVRCTYTDGTYEDFDHRSIEVYAGGGTVQLIKGYCFKEAGKKDIVVAFLDYKTTYTLTVY